MVHRGLVTIAALLCICFLMLSTFETQFFLLHFYQSLIYLVIILMLFYFEDRWAYSLGILVPATWLVLNFLTGMLGGAARQVSRLMSAQTPSNKVSFIAAVIAVLAVALIASCGYRWKQEFAGSGQGRRTFLISALITAVYYAILIIWFWEIVPQAPTK